MELDCENGHGEAKNAKYQVFWANKICSVLSPLGSIRWERRDRRGLAGRVGNDLMY